ncbi:MAG: MTAP family purine nucleoside phosphorylase [Nitrospinota bacterium]
MSGSYKTKLAVIGGSRAYDMLRRGAFGPAVKSFRPKTPYGKSAPLHLFQGNGFTFYFLSRHGEKGYDLAAPFVNYRANIRALKDKGVERIVSWSGPGAINSKMKPGHLVLPDDAIDFTKDRQSTFFDGTGKGFIRMNEPFCPEIRKILASSAPPRTKIHKSGVYCCTQGPRLETRAEIKMFGRMGADLVGMTLLPEAFLARELEICYAPLCYVTNYAESVKQRDFKSGVLFEGMQSAAEKKSVESALDRFPYILMKSLKHLSAMNRKCGCQNAMKRYRKKDRPATSGKL